MTVDNSLLQAILQRIKSVCQPSLVILFGSAATGKMTADSDIDLLVIEPAPANPRKESVVIRQALRGLPHPFDIIVMSHQRFDETKNVIGGIAYPAHKYGKVIYEAA